MTGRSGTTLIEVLVAIFVMGIGLIALLVLFPLGALRMAQAIQDEYCARAAANADAVATLQRIRTDPLVRLDAALGYDVFLDPDGRSERVLFPPTLMARATPCLSIPSACAPWVSYRPRTGSTGSPNQTYGGKGRPALRVTWSLLTPQFLKFTAGSLWWTTSTLTRTAIRNLFQASPPTSEDRA